MSEEKKTFVGTWNHRVIRRYNSMGEPYLAITEVHYHDGVPYAFAEDWAPQGYDYDADGTKAHDDIRALDQLRTEINRVLRALDKPILDEKSDFSDSEYKSE